MRDRRRTTCLAQGIVQIRNKTQAFSQPFVAVFRLLASMHSINRPTDEKSPRQVNSTMRKEACKGMLKVPGYLKRQARMHADEARTIGHSTPPGKLICACRPPSNPALLGADPAT